MSWYAISGSWNEVSEEVRRDVEFAAHRILERGDGIIVGGALGVDCIATQVFLDAGEEARIQIFLPIALDNFCDHYRKRADEGVITQEQADKILSQLMEVKRKAPQAIHDDTDYEEADRESYHSRNTSIAKECDVLMAFHVNESEGTQDAIDKARALGKKVVVKRYQL